MKTITLNPDALAMIIAALEKEQAVAEWQATLSKYGEKWMQEHQAKALKIRTLLDYLNS